MPKPRSAETRVAERHDLETIEGGPRLRPDGLSPRPTVEDPNRAEPLSGGAGRCRAARVDGVESAGVAWYHDAP